MKQIIQSFKTGETILEEVLNHGWDYVLIDSFMDAKDKIKDTSNMNASTVESWLINLMVKHTKGQNDTKKYTAFDVIQHIKSHPLLFLKLNEDNLL